jgi:hypothetical protein
MQDKGEGIRKPIEIQNPPFIGPQPLYFLLLYVLTMHRSAASEKSFGFTAWFFFFLSLSDFEVCSLVCSFGLLLLFCTTHSPLFSSVSHFCGSQFLIL